MSQLFRKEALERRSRALFGEVRLRSPLGTLATVAIVASALALIGYLLFGIGVGGQTVWSWLNG